MFGKQMVISFHLGCDFYRERDAPRKYAHTCARSIVRIETASQRVIRYCRPNGPDGVRI